MITQRFSKLLLLFFCPLGFISAQTGWTWTELAAMPESVSNNAVTQAFCGDSLCVYSFCGIDSTKSPTGIHLHSWRFNTVSGQWSALPEAPDAQGKIAAAASTVNNMIYVIGGYHVNDNFSEVSSNKVHIFDPQTNSWQPDGANIPTATDDHVQVVYQDSLIFVITGWSNTTNITAVQIYNPEFDSWESGTPLPNLNTFKSFGASGHIVGDSIFYMGGVSSSSFSATDYFRSGVIDPQDPTNIQWELLDDYPGSAGYRMASASWNDRVFWIGGSSVSYNFDGIAYNGSGGVSPEFRISTYFSESGIWDEGPGAPFGVMDLRGLAQVTPTSWIICGGMSEGQEVSNRTFLIALDTSADLLVNPIAPKWKIANGWLTVAGLEAGQIRVWNSAGAMVASSGSNTIKLPDLSPGIYHFSWESERNVVSGSFYSSGK